jgi:uncharacterized protein YcfJ
MKPLIILTAAATILPLCGCTSDPYYNNHVAGGVAAGAIIGGGVGAVAGSAIPGLGTAAGAVIGAGVGGTVGGVVAHNHYYRGTHGYCYWVDSHGYAHYNYHIRC